MQIKNIFNLLFCLFVVGVSYGQQKDVSIIADNDTSLQKVFYFHASKTDYVIKDLLCVDEDFCNLHYYDPILSMDNSFCQYLSVMGTPSSDLIYKTDKVLDYQRQPNNYKPYVFVNETDKNSFFYNRKTVKYFQTQKAYSAFSYNAGTDKQQYFNVIFSKNLYRSLNLQTEYNVNYADGNLANSQVMNQFFNVSLNYISPKGRYKNSASFIHSRAYILENGGILSDSIFINSDYSSMETYPTALSQGWSKWKTNEFYFNQSLRLSKSMDKNFGALVHSISLEKYARLYNDENKTYLDSLATTMQRNSLFWTNVTKKEITFPIRFGINYDFITYADSLTKKTFVNFSPETRFSFKDFIEISYLYTFADNKYNKDYQLDLSLNHVYMSKRGPITLIDSYIKANIQNKRADYIFAHYSTENLYWNNNTGKTKTKSITLGFRLKKILALELSFFDIKNRYWFDTNYQTYYGDTRLYQINLKNDFHFGPFTLKGLLSIQKASNDEVIRLPLLNLKQSLYYSFLMMQGKLPAKLGVDIYYTTSYYADKYSTLTGMFVRQNDMQIGNHIYADLFLSMKIQRFTIFASLLHLSSFLQEHNYFNSPLYPHNGFAFRYGLSWKFLD